MKREQEYFDQVKEALTQDALIAAYDIEFRKDTILKQKKYMRDSHGDMDDHEFLQNMTNVNNDTLFVANESKRMDLLTRQIESPYFGKITFRFEDGDELPMYIGAHGYVQGETAKQLVFDWRAPVASMYYGFGKGPAHYTVDQETFSGEITEKKQFDISRGNLHAVMDVEEQLNDKLLVGALSGNSSAKMKSVVATIQKEQDEIIRNTTATNLIVDGRAGSGKTVIAMHRLAWLLYNHRQTMTADNVMILSPNGIFGDYIAGVLPEIGEDNVPEKEFDSLMDEVLFLEGDFEGKLDQADYLADEPAPERVKAIKAKSSVELYEKLNIFLAEYVSGFAFKDFHYEKATFTSEELVKLFTGRFAKYPVYERFEKIAYFIADRVEDVKATDLDEKKRGKLEADITKNLIRMYGTGNLVELYTAFLESLEDEDLMAYTNDYGQIRYEDALILFYMQMYFYGCKSYHTIKHLVVDEMQDYNVFQHAVIHRIFPCKKTILGDRNQVLLEGNDVMESLAAVLESYEVKELKISYRSTAEITEFCNEILGIEDDEKNGSIFSRHGKAPEVVDLEGMEEILEFIDEKLSYGDMDAFDNIAILCDDEAEAFAIYKELSEMTDVTYLTNQSTVYSGGTVVMPKFLAKGMEFDAVFVVNKASSMGAKHYVRNYYISCTRALHELYVLNVK